MQEGEGVESYLATLPQFALAFVASLAALAVAIAIYVAITPIREFAQIEAGNAAAAISLAGALFGLVLPIGSAIVHSRDLIDLLVWSLVALVAQLIVYAVLCACWHGVARRVAEGSHAHAIALGAIAIAVGVLNAACLTT